MLKSEFVLVKDELKPVTKDNPYYWRVRAIDGASNEGEWSEVRAFSTGFLLTLPNGELELTLSAMVVYGISAFIAVIIILSFLLGRRSSPY